MAPLSQLASTKTAGAVPGQAMAWVWQGQPLPTQAAQAVKEAPRVERGRSDPFVLPFTQWVDLREKYGISVNNYIIWDNMITDKYGITDGITDIRFNHDGTTDRYE